MLEIILFLYLNKITLTDIPKVYLQTIISTLRVFIRWDDATYVETPPNHSKLRKFIVSSKMINP